MITTYKEHQNATNFLDKEVHIMEAPQHINTRRKAIDAYLEMEVNFWEAKLEGNKSSKYYAAVPGSYNVITLSKSEYLYAMSKKTYNNNMLASA